MICISLAAAAAENQIRLLRSMINLQIYQKYLIAECEVIRDIRILRGCGELEEGTYETGSYTYELSLSGNTIIVTLQEPYETLCIETDEDGTLMDYEAYRDPEEIINE